MLFYQRCKIQLHYVPGHQSELGERGHGFFQDREQPPVQLHGYHFPGPEAELLRQRTNAGANFQHTAAAVCPGGVCNIMNNATLLEKYGVPAKNAEGFLFPDTYQLTRSQESNGPAVVEAMLKVFDREAKKLWPQGPPPPDELMRVVTLASLVERETGAPEERPRIAGVFMNRLRLGMRLQCDPTTIYGMGPDFGGKLTRADLENTDNLYNTYARAGLPPGPICSPGLASLKAAMNPEQNDYIYFVAKGDGTHAFSRTLDEHNRAVRFYQLHRDASYRSTLGGPAAPDMAPPPAPATDPANAAKASPAKAEPVKAAKASAAKAKTAKTKSGAKKAKAKTATHQKHKG